MRKSKHEKMKKNEKNEKNQHTNKREKPRHENHMLWNCCAGQEEVVLSHPCFNPVRTCLRYVRVIHCLPLRDLNCRCAVRRASCSILFMLRGNVLCLSLRVSSLSSNCLAVVPKSITEIGGTSTTNLAALAFIGAPAVQSVAEPVNQYTVRFFSGFATFASFAHVLVICLPGPGSITWQPVSNSNQLPCCDASPALKMRKPTSASLYQTRNLRPFPNRKCDSTTLPCAGSSGAVTDCNRCAVLCCLIGSSWRDASAGTCVPHPTCFAR